MKKMKLIIMLSVLVGFFASAQKTYYVSSQNGNDNNSGLDQNVAFKSIQKAVNSVNEGDTVRILSGIYTGGNDSPWSEIFMSISGSEGKYITFSGVPDAQGKLPTIVSASVKGIDMLGSSYVIIENLEFVPANQDVKGMIDNPSFGLELWRARRAIGIDNGSHHIIIRNNYVHDFPGNGIAIGGSEVVLIEGNLVEHCAFRSQNGNSGISSYQPANLDVSSFPEYPNHRIIYKNNVSRYNVNLRGFLGGGNRITDGNGIIVDDHIQDQKENGVPYNSRTLLIGNICYGNGGQGINVFSSDNVDVYNNTLFDNAQSTRISNPAYPIAVGDSQLSIGRVKNARVKNNILYNSNDSKTTISRYQDENITYDQNIHWNITGNPEPINSNDFIVNPKLKNIQALSESQTILLATTSNPFNINGASAKLFTPTENNNFPVQDMNLQSNSPAIDRGVNVGFGTIIGGSIDIGAKEFQGTINTFDDMIVSTLVPNEVVVGQEINITVSYEAKENRDISIVFQLDSSPYTVYKTNRIRVSEGLGTIDIPIFIPENTPLGIDKYQFQVYITSVGGDWNNRLGNLNKPNIDCVSGNTVTQVLEVGAKGNCSGEQIEILLDNESVAQFILTNDIEVYRYVNYKEGQNIKIAFVNDDNSSCDLNAYIDWIKICDTLYQTEDYSSRTGCGSSEWLYCNGNFDFGNLPCGQNRNGETTMEALEIYPNPISNSFFIEHIKNESLSIKVINLEGKILKSFQSKTDDVKSTFAIEDLPKGMYLISIYSKISGDQKTIKIYKE
ncbi:T9SS C-terminal target domain-containing protein [Aquimarina sp. AD1]|nr:T9SS C-terminal target domain-containing protein [Aquimarina sp. AD1]RKN13628.1 T9SS C-terminal target domain-containing protein [Aquimarina sp. AD1]